MAKQRKTIIKEIEAEIKAYKEACTEVKKGESLPNKYNSILEDKHKLIDSIQVYMDEKRISNAECKKYFYEIEKTCNSQSGKILNRYCKDLLIEE